MAYAGFWLRVVAYVIDWVVLYAVWAIYLLIAMNEATLLAAGLAWQVIVWLYFAGLESSARQATLGKMAVGIQVTDDRGQRISFGRALGRSLAKLLSGAALMIGFLMVGWTARKQGLHDLITGTLVIKKGSAPDTGAGGEAPLMYGRAPERPTPR